MLLTTILSGWLFVDKRSIVDALPELVRKLWHDWELRILVLVSLTLQILLIVVGNCRKYNPGAWLRMFIWSAYLMADWVATVALGVLSKKQGNPCTCAANVTAANVTSTNNDELMAFWAPFLLLHLGGPDTITAYAIADNELWLRHLLGLVVQMSVAFYVTITAWNGTWLSFLTIPMLFSGVIKYGERSLALRSANREQFLDSLLDRPDPGPNYAKFVEEFSLKKDEGFNVEMKTATDNSDAGSGDNNSAANTLERGEGFSASTEVIKVADNSYAGSGDNNSAANTGQLLTHAYRFFQCFKRLFVDLILSFQDRDESQSFFQNSLPEYGFKLVEMELGFAYDAFYTKAPIIYTKWGCIFRFLTSSITIIVFVLFLFVEKHNHLLTDLIITYILLAGAIVLDFYAVILLLLSDMTELWLRNHKYQVISSFLPSNKKRWSNSLAQYNLLSFSLKDKPLPCLNDKRVQKIVRYLPGLKTLEKHRYEYRCKISDDSDLKILIFEHFLEKSKLIKQKAEVNKGNEEYNKYIASLCSARGRHVIEEYGPEDKHSSTTFGWSTEQVEFDKSILIWHIATDLCYHSDGGEKFAEENQTCQGSKNLSDYMLYLLIMCPFMLPIGIGMMRFRDTCEEVKEFSKENVLYKHNLPKMLLEVSSDQVEPIMVKGDRSKSVLFDGCRLANQLQKIGEKEQWNKEKKWNFVCNVWIEILGYAASHCRGYYHVQQLSMGGELLTHVWLLMAHLGITEQFQINRGHARLKLVAK